MAKQLVVVGMDEVGRGSWAGPLVVGAVILASPILGLKDSKLLTKRRREVLDQDIRRRAMAYALGEVTPGEIDALGLTAASSLAYQRALAHLDHEYDEIIIDGSYNYLPNVAGVCVVVDADHLVPAVSAASIVAKVARDTFMYQLASHYPGYGFDKHVGYGTAAHSEALERLGPCDQHRKSFAPVRAYLEVGT